MELPEDQRKKFKGDVYYAGFEACIRIVLDHIGADSALLVYCDLSEQYSEHCVNLFNKLRSKNKDFKDRCFGISFAEDERFAALQAADMVAYCSRAITLGTSLPIIADLYKILFGNAQHSSVLYRAGGDGLGHGELEKGVRA